MRMDMLHVYWNGIGAGHIKSLGTLSSFPWLWPASHHPSSENIDLVFIWYSYTLTFFNWYNSIIIVLLLLFGVLTVSSVGKSLGNASSGWVVLRPLPVRCCGPAQSVWVWAGVLAAAGGCWCDKAASFQAMPVPDNCLGDAALQLLHLAGGELKSLHQVPLQGTEWPWKALG